MQFVTIHDCGMHFKVDSLDLVKVKWLELVIEVSKVVFTRNAAGTSVLLGSL